jgi:hypothetical protein
VHDRANMRRELALRMRAPPCAECGRIRVAGVHVGSCRSIRQNVTHRRVEGGREGVEQPCKVAATAQASD